LKYRRQAPEHQPVLCRAFSEFAGSCRIKAKANALNKIREVTVQSAKRQDQTDRHHSNDQRVLDDLSALFVFGKPDCSGIEFIENGSHEISFEK
jgi:hypothetical protein